MNPASANKKGDVGKGTQGAQDLHYHTLHKVGPWAWGPSAAHGLWKEGMLELWTSLIFYFGSYGAL